MKFREASGSRLRVLLLIAACVVGAMLLTLLVKISTKQTLHGLLIDLELGDPNPSRHGELRRALTQRLTDEVAFLRRLKVTLDYVHYSEATRELLNTEQVDFVVLSPQVTPWYMYRGNAGTELEALKDRIRDLITRTNKPVLGICGGHQFLAMIFGGKVGFIDPAFEGKTPERYPKEAASERGVTILETVSADPIFAGLADHPGRFRAMESHYEEVKTVPAPFVNLARSLVSEAQLIRIPGRTVYGMAFHPERGWDTDRQRDLQPEGGKRVLANFFVMVAAQKRGAPPRQEVTSWTR